jgi:hypothetical protein
MDLLETLRAKVDALQDGPYAAGLRAVILHVETAFRHLSRGQADQDETAFTDAVYRTNQAFEGSVKEAYRVLAGQDPSQKRPYDIERYLEEHEVFRPRVLSQFTNYRREWRNPSTHDYKLDFDESEAFLAIVNISAFACLVLDQIIQQLARDLAKSQASAASQPAPALDMTAEAGFLQRTIALFIKFSRQQVILEASNPRKTEMQVLGALTGYLEAAATDMTLTIEPLLSREGRERADMVVSKEGESILVELKNGLYALRNYHNAIAQVEHYMIVSGIKQTILYFYTDDAFDPIVTRREVPALGGCITIIHPPNALLPNKSVER